MWKIRAHKKVAKKVEKLPAKIRLVLALLIKDLEKTGPLQHKWDNFSKLKDRHYHCHIKKGRPTYVACWKVIDKKIEVLEIYYVGSHEKAPY